jgi:hypothetical protein
MPLRFLAHPKLEAALNKPHHGLTLPELQRTLLSLASRRWIRFMSSRSVRLTPDQLLASLQRWRRTEGPTVYYGLTARGSGVWERFALPDWQRYVRCASSMDDSGEWEHEVVCASEDRLRRYLQRVVAADLSDAERKALRPWKALYWKQLEVGYNVTFRTRTYEEAWRPGAEDAAWERWYWPR